jgi:hypothetical protein
LTVHLAPKRVAIAGRRGIFPLGRFGRRQETHLGGQDDCREFHAATATAATTMVIAREVTTAAAPIVAAAAAPKANPLAVIRNHVSVHCLLALRGQPARSTTTTTATPARLPLLLCHAASCGLAFQRFFAQSHCFALLLSLLGSGLGVVVGRAGAVGGKGQGLGFDFKELLGARRSVLFS